MPLVVFFLTLCQAAPDAPSALALLRGVEVARATHSSVKARIEIHREEHDTEMSLEGLVELDGARLRFEVRPRDASDEVILRDGDVFYAYRRKENEALEVYDLNRAIGARGDVAFDPRVLGLSDLMSCDLRVEDCLWHHSGERLTVSGREKVRGVDVWRVTAARDDGAVAEFWIEEPSFRVHRKTEAGFGIDVLIDSEFADRDNRSPFPSRVSTRRTEPPHAPVRQSYIVSDFAAGLDIPDHRFTLESMNLPVNTPAVDYRINRNVGYWNGEELQESPVRAEREPAPEPPKSQWLARRWLLMANVLLLLAVIAFLWWRNRRVASRIK